MGCCVLLRVLELIVHTRLPFVARYASFNLPMYADPLLETSPLSSCSLADRRGKKKKLSFVVLAPFSLDYQSGGTAAPSPHACASAHSSPANRPGKPGQLNPPSNLAANSYSYSDLRQASEQPHGGYQHPSGQVMLTGPVYSDGLDGPTVPIHHRRPSPPGSGTDDCQSGSCSTPDTCNPPPPPPSIQQHPLPPPSSLGYPHAQQERQRPDRLRHSSDFSSRTGTGHSTSDSPDYSSLGGGSYESPAQPTPASSIMQSPPIQPVHLQRPIFGQPSPGAQYAGDISLPSPSTLFSVPSYDSESDVRRSVSYSSGPSSYPYPNPLPPPHAQPAQSTRQPQYGSYSISDVEDLMGADRHDVYDDRKPIMGRSVSDYTPAGPSSNLLPPYPASSSSSYSAPAPPPHLQLKSASMESMPVGSSSNSGEQTAFISKLWHLLTHSEYERYLRWNKAGDAFILTNSNGSSCILLLLLSLSNSRPSDLFLLSHSQSSPSECSLDSSDTATSPVSSDSSTSTRSRGSARSDFSCVSPSWSSVVRFKY